MRRRRRGSNREFLWPFILMIGALLIVVLFVQLVASFFGQKEAEMRNKANFYIDQGRAELMEWGNDDFVKAYDGGVVLEGDSVKTNVSSFGVLVLYNGTEIRFDESTTVTLDTLENHGDEDEVILELEKGQIWVNQVVSDKGTLDLTVKTNNVIVYSGVSEYAVSNRGEQAVRVMQGEVLTELVERDGKDIVIDESEVGVGQQLYMSSTDVADLIARKNMNFIEALSDEWKESDFYVWNATYESEDRSEKSEEDLEDEIEDVEIEEEDLGPEDPELLLTNPPKSPYVLDGTQITLTGTVSGFASRIVVTSFDEYGNADPYQLSQFEAGDTEWSYASAIEWGNLYEGENEFIVAAFDSEGYEADSLTIVINVGGELEEEASEEEVVSEEEEATVEEDDVVELSCGDITTPVVDTVGGEEWTGEMYSDEEGYVSVTGTVECAYAIEINGYQLTLFEAGDTAWSYTAAADFNNLFEGENTYTVYALDADGNRVGDAAEFSIEYIAVEGEEVSEE